MSGHGAAAPPGGWEPTGLQRAVLVSRIVAAIDGECAVDPHEAGILLARVHREADRDELEAVAARLDELVARSGAVRSVSLRRAQLRSFGWLAVAAVISALLVIALLHGLNAVSPP